MTNKAHRPNPHVSYDLTLRPHHRVIAGLVREYGKPDCSILDVGCGMGHLVQLISQLNPRTDISVADIDQTVLDVTGGKVKVAEAIRIESVESLFDLGKQYDIVILSHVLEHTLRPADIVTGIVEYLLKPDGYLILAVPNLGRFEVSIYHLLRRDYVNRGHVYGWDRPHWMNFLENILGLWVVKYQPDYFPLPKIKNIRFLIPFLEWIVKLAPWWSYSNIAVIKKSLEGEI